MYHVLACFFFFQAEDGIRDDLVTGVQTCALPISFLGLSELRRTPRRRGQPASAKRSRPRRASRSEERRVGKECRSRGWPYHSKQKESGRDGGAGPNGVWGWTA